MSSWARAEESDAFMDILRAHGIEAMLNFTSLGMEGINDTDLRGFQAFAMTLYVGIDTAVFSDETLTPVVEKTLLLLVEQEANLDGIAFQRLEIWITFYDIEDDTYSKGVQTSFHTFKEAQEMGLTGEALIEYLGGYTT